MDGYDIVSNAFIEWIKSQSFIDRFYVAVFEARRNNLTPYEFFTELFELDQNYKIIWQIDWCEGKNDIINLRFYSFSDIENIIIDAENHDLNNTCRKWFNKKN